MLGYILLGLVAMVIIGKMLLMYLDKCSHEWKQIDGITYHHKDGTFHSRMIVYQCKTCKKIKKVQY